MDWRRLRAKLLRRWKLRRSLPGCSYPKPSLTQSARHFCAAETALAERDFRGAGMHFLSALRRAPNSLDLAERVLGCAREVARSEPTTPRAYPPPQQSFSVIVCSADDQRFESFASEIKRAMTGSQWELIRIADARSMCEGYNRGFKRSEGELLMFCHDDIGFIADAIPSRIEHCLQSTDVMGVAGTDRLLGPAWWAAGTPYLHSWVCSRAAQGGFLLNFMGAYGPVVSGVEALDGMFIAARRSAVKRLGFDDSTFDGFHFYDIDFAWRASRLGLKVSIALDLTTWHLSGGTFDAKWQEGAVRLLRKFPELADRVHAPRLTVPFLELRDEGEVRAVVDVLASWVASR